MYKVINLTVVLVVLMGFFMFISGTFPEASGNPTTQKPELTCPKVKCTEPEVSCLMMLIPVPVMACSLDQTCPMHAQTRGYVAAVVETLQDIQEVGTGLSIDLEKLLISKEDFNGDAGVPKTP